MFKRIALCALVVLASRAPAYAQSPHVEVSGFAGWTFSDGVSADTAVVAGDGNIYDRVDPKDSAPTASASAPWLARTTKWGACSASRCPSLSLAGRTTANWAT